MPQYIKEHNERFAVPAKISQDAHRPVQLGQQELERVCALHHQRRLSGALTCQFEGSQIWIEPGQQAAPKKAAQVDIVQYADRRLEVLYRGQVLKAKHCVLHEHLGKKLLVSDKTINTRVDALARQQRQVAKVAIEIRLQEDLRQAGIAPNTHPSPPPVAWSRFGLRPSQLHATG